MGTSLTVHPFASLTELVPDECARLLLNLDHVGGWGSRPNDVACLMTCDKAVRELCKLLGWEEELETLWTETKPIPKAAVQTSSKGGAETNESKGKKDEEEAETGPTIDSRNKEVVEDIVDELAKNIGEVRLEDKKSAEPADQPEKPAAGDETKGTSKPVMDNGDSPNSPPEQKDQKEGSEEVTTRVAEPTHDESADKLDSTIAPGTGKL